MLVDVLAPDPQWASWSDLATASVSASAFPGDQCSDLRRLSLAFSTVAALDEAITGLGLTLLEVPRPALFLAGKAFVRYQREGACKNNALADFFIGAHAAVLDCSIRTRDGRRYHSYFPNIAWVTPSASELS